MKQPTIGSIVEFFPSTNGVINELPNGMQSAPAIVTQTFGEHTNMIVFLADTSGNPIRTAWSVVHKDSVYLTEGGSYWDWPKDASQ